MQTCRIRWVWANATSTYRDETEDGQGRGHCKTTDSGRSGLASAGKYLEKYGPLVVAAGASNHLSPNPLTWIPKFTLLRAMAVTIDDPEKRLVLSSISLRAAIDLFKKKWSMVPMNCRSRTRAYDSVSVPVMANALSYEKDDGRNTCRARARFSA
jgi:hypothetical protein